MKYIYLTFLYFILPLTINAQDLTDYNSLNLISFSLGGGIDFPQKDLKNKFGRSNNISVSMDYITKNSNLFGSIFTSFSFGNNVKEDVISNLRSSDGTIVGTDQLLANIVLRQRLINSGMVLGKIFSFNNSKNRAGIRIGLGASLLIHKIRVLDDNNTVPQVAGDYIKGYDRLTSGMGLVSQVGYQFLSSNKKINFHVFVEYTRGFTKNTRAYNFSAYKSDNTKRNDSLISLKGVWVLPFYLDTKGEEIFY